MALKRLPQAERLLSGVLSANLTAVAVQMTVSNPPLSSKLPTLIEIDPNSDTPETVRVIAVAGSVCDIERGVYNGGVGSIHNNNVPYKQKITQLHWDAVANALESGYLTEDVSQTFTRNSTTELQIESVDHTLFYTQGRMLRINGTVDCVVESSAFSGGHTVITVSGGSLPTPITSIELAIQPRDMTKFLKLFAVAAILDALSIDAIAEKTNGAGVTVDGILLKDSLDVSGIIDKASAQTITGRKDFSAGAFGAWDGWQIANEAWAFDSADAPTFTISVPSDATTKYSPGMRIKLTHGGSVKYFIITKVATTVLTLYGGTDYTLAAGAITLPYYSTQKAPLGFPLNPNKWTVEVLDTDNDTTDPAAATWYNLGSVQISIPIGVWRTSYKALLYIAKAASVTTDWGYITLSTANNSASDADLTTANSLGGASGSLALATPQYCEKTLVIAAKTSYYLNCMASADLNTIGVYGGIEKTIIRAVCSYL